MVLSALGFNCLGTGANYNHLSQKTTAASAYASVRKMAAGGEAATVLAVEGTTSDTEGHMSPCFRSHWLCRRDGGAGGHPGEQREAGERDQVFTLFMTHEWNTSITFTVDQYINQVHL